jgi:SAM-dependent methyltransferase
MKKSEEINNLIKKIRESDGFIKGQENRILFLKKIKSILDEHNIDFWLGYGTLIGCLRHSGIIPWDDDIDICMNRKDYGRFFSINWENYGIYIERPYEKNMVLHYVKDIKNPDDFNLDLFIVPVGLKSDEGGYYRYKEELYEEEIYPLISAKFEGEEFLIPVNPNDFFKRRYFGMDVLKDCSVWNRTVNNLYKKEFDHNLFKINIEDLDYSLWGSSNNKEYWDNFYKSNKAPEKNTDFSYFVSDFLKKDNEIRTLLDIGCGNGRDSEYFSSKYEVTGIDLSPPIIESMVRYLKGNVTDMIKDSYDVYYMRFLVHAITEMELDILLSNINKSMKDGSYIFIETRSSKGISDCDRLETNFKSSVGDPHFRLHYSLNYLKKKVESFGFIIVYEKEDKNLARFKEENPYVIRIVCKKK